MADSNSWSKSQSKKMKASTVSEGRVRHANATTWYDNFPMEQEYTEYFNCTFTQGYEAAGTKLYEPLWGDHIYSGGGDGFRSYIGFNKSAIQSFVGDGEILDVDIHINLRETSLNGRPTVNFYPHIANSIPSSWQDSYVNKNYKTTYTFPNDSESPGLGGYWKDLTANHIKNPNSGSFFSGIALIPYSNTEEDWGVFTGKKGYNTQLRIKVLK